MGVLCQTPEISLKTSARFCAIFVKKGQNRPFSVFRGGEKLFWDLAKTLYKEPRVTFYALSENHSSVSLSFTVTTLSADCVKKVINDKASTGYLS